MEDAAPLRRHVSARIVSRVDGPARLALQVAVAVPRGEPGLSAVERLDVLLDGEPLAAAELVSADGCRVHLVETRGPCRVEVEYTAAVTGRAAPRPSSELSLLAFLRPSRYAEADALAAVALAELGASAGPSVAREVAAWVGQRLLYAPGSSRPGDGAVATLLAGRGVCRDYAHLTVALLRALDVPARVAAVYAPGLDPMDFHAVAEAWVDGRWEVVDPTLLAPRGAMLRIATGRDTADTAFLSSYGANLELLEIGVTATTEGALPGDDPRDVVELG